MSDYDNIREDRFIAQQEREEKARQESIDYHADNWMTAVTKSVEKSNGTFKDVTDYDSKLDNRGFQKRKATSIDVFIEELHNSDFMERAARILIDLYDKGSMPPNAKIRTLIEEMAQNYAEFQYESNIKD